MRDGDGSGLVMLPESDLAVLEGFASWSQRLQRLSVLVDAERVVSVAELGDLAWLRVFDKDDQRAFADELHESLIAGLADQDLSSVDEVVAAWRVTARQLEDPLRRSVLLGRHDLADYDDAEEPVE
ncbi:hypothetical protein [Cryobacterium sp. TMT3-29-2]|uniref:hypothetical protein n=1 Tax=Cryobacterium sp. TMT3-29-2 TaxID=2555867 RepID=UPI0010735AB6|nr:hypothetical protein [Cryobacterium sp. TMT3-29-2]TFC93554.1 hypothetical protein E3O67_01600 [Cryobacterium sp. TMT3-29-2]